METRGTHSQREMPFLGAVREPEMVADDLIRACRSGRQAMSLCIRMSGLTDECVAELMDMSKGYLSKVLSGRASLDADRRIKLMRVCGNYAPLQYEAETLGFDLTEKAKDARIKELEAQLARLRAA